MAMSDYPLNSIHQQSIELSTYQTTSYAATEFRTEHTYIDLSRHERREVFTTDLKSKQSQPIKSFALSLEDSIDYLELPKLSLSV